MYKRKSWKSLDASEKFNSHEEWKCHIKNKYKDFSKVDLEEFRRYLIHRKRRIRPISDFTNPFISAILSAVMTYLITGNVINTNEGSKQIIVLIACAVAIVLVLGGFAVLVATCMNIFVSNGMEEIFWSDYQEVITEMLEEQEKQKEKETDFQIIMEAMKKMEGDINQLQETVKVTNDELKSVNETFKKMNEKADEYCNIKEEKKQKNRWNQLLKKFW